MWLAKNLARTKMSVDCELEERHGTYLGAGYKNNQLCATFINTRTSRQPDWYNN